MSCLPVDNVHLKIWHLVRQHVTKLTFGQVAAFDCYGSDLGQTR